MKPPERIQPVCQAFLDGLQAVLGKKLYGVILYGALAFPEAAPTCDIDLQVILKEALSETEKSGQENLHAALAQDFPPLGAELDACYILLEDARRTSPPRFQLFSSAVDVSWALHRAHFLAGRCIVLYGPEPEKVYPQPTWPEIEDALYGELDYVGRHLKDYPDYCILNSCRLIYSFETRDVVVSKAAAAAWASEALPEWKGLIEAAKRFYARQATPQDREFTRSQAPALFHFALGRIQQVTGSRGKESQDV
jgi:hypothetical protein